MVRNIPTFLGTVQDVKGETISVALDVNTISGLAFIDGYGYRIGQVGSFVRIPLGYVDLFGIVSEVGAGAVPERLVNSEPYGNRWMTIQVIGEGQSGREFERGVSQYPTIGDSVHLLTENDLSRVYGRPESPDYVRVGHLASAESIPALVNVDKLVTRHSAILGATGSGKSTTVAGILTALSNTTKYPSARIIVLDVHGEYAKALRDRGTVFAVRPDPAKNEMPLVIPYWAMNFDELLPITFGDLDDMARGAILERITDLKTLALQKNHREGVNEDNLTIDTPVPFSINKLWFDLYCEVNATHTTTGGQSEATWALLLGEDDNPVERGDPLRVIPPKFKPHTLGGGTGRIFLSQSPLNIRKQVETLGTRLRDPRLNFLFKPGSWFPNIDGDINQDLDCLLKQWIGGTNPIAVLDLSGIPISILTNLIGVLLRVIYDALFWARDLSEGGRERPLLLVLEEAHNYCEHGNVGPAATMVKRIVKEGRKYGIGAMLVSQRPAEIDATILSQCGTIFAMRLSNASDRVHVTGVVTDNLEGLFRLLPALRIGEAIIVGESVRLPVRALIEAPPPDRRPDSEDPLVYNSEGPGGWNRGKEDSDYLDVVGCWRKQDPRSEVANMERQPLVSTNVASAGYDPNSRTLEVEFTNGSVYQYFDVPQHVYDGLLTASSTGSFLHAQIKGHYRYAKV